ncbi:MAG: hypothetical protein RR481_07610, partial [Longicatena sp.]
LCDYIALKWGTSPCFSLKCRRPGTKKRICYNISGKILKLECEKGLEKNSKNGIINYIKESDKYIACSLMDSIVYDVQKCAHYIKVEIHHEVWLVST